MALPEGAAQRIYRIMCNVATCDGHLDESERKVLDAAVSSFGLGAEEASALEAEGSAGEGIVIGEDPAERQALITAMIDVAAADGRIDSAERKRLVRVAKRIGLSPQELEAQLLPRL